MEPILKLRRGTSPSTIVDGEPFFNTDSKTLQVGDGSSTVTLVRLGLNTGSIEFTGDITNIKCKPIWKGYYNWW